MFPLEAIFDIGNKLIDKLIPDPAAKAQAQQKLLELQQQGQLAELQADMNEANNISDRWKADAGSDSWLAKNIRPLTLIFILFAYSFFAFMSMLGHETRGAYVELLGQWGMLVMTAYFGGRSLEKIMDMKNKQ